jgi:hypothetical protein
MISLPNAPAEWGPEASRPDLERVLAVVLAGVKPIWVVEDAYNGGNEPAWRITLALPAPQGQWALRRYRYDVPSRTLHFIGEQPLSEAALAEIRRTARRMV